MRLHRLPLGREPVRSPDPFPTRTDSRHDKVACDLRRPPCLGPRRFLIAVSPSGGTLRKPRSEGACARQNGVFAATAPARSLPRRSALTPHGLFEPYAPAARPLLPAARRIAARV